MATKAAEAAKTKDQYTAENIGTLSFPDSVRAKPGMYIGPTTEDGVFSILREVLDNCVDEALAGRASVCNVFLDGNTFYVWDDGNGIPQGSTKYRDVEGNVKSVDTLRAVCGILHASGKFDDSAYKVSRGSHGIGQKATNALSTEFIMTTCYKGTWSSIEYARGLEKKLLVGKAKAAINPITGKPLKNGTLVQFSPDPKIFSPCTLRVSDVVEWSTVAAFFTPGLTVNLHVTKGADIIEKTYNFPEGPKAFVKTRLAKLKVEPISPKNEVFIANNALIDCVVQFTNHDGADINAFTNGLRNVDGGVHVNSMLKAFVEALEPYRKAKQTFGAQELKDGLVALINVKLSHPVFASQTKEKLVDDRAKEPVAEFLAKELKVFFKDNKSLAELLCERAQSLKGLKEDFLSSKKARTAIKNAGMRGFHPRALVAAEAKPHERELFIVEGDSAAGSATTAREWWQEVLPLKGKITNAHKKPAEALENEEVVQILAHIGYKPDSSSPLDELRVSKIIIMADPDPDGPLIGDTLVPVRFRDRNTREFGPVEVMKIEDMVTPDIQNREIYVRSFDGRQEVLAQATNVRVTDYSTDQVEIRTQSGAKMICHPNHAWMVKAGARYDSRLEVRLNNGLHVLSSRSIKTGDRLLLLDGKSLTEDMVTKVKRYTVQEPVAYYCLTVSGYGCFALANNILSKNCHISSLLLTLFKVYLPGLFERGMVYTTRVPELYAMRDGEILTAPTVTELQQLIQKKGWPKTDIEHVKGYGKVQPSFLKRIAFDPRTRLLRQITAMEVDDGDNQFAKVMGEGAEGRRILLGI